MGLVPETACGLRMNRFGCGPCSAVVRVLQGCDARSVRALIPDPRVLERGFYDVAIVDMEDTAEPAVLEADLSLLRRQWPVAVVQSMTWLKNELDIMHTAAKKRYRHSRSGHVSPCVDFLPGITRCRGAPCERARHRTVWATSVGHTMCLRTIGLHASTVSFRPGLSGVRFGSMPLNHVIREFRLMFSSLVK